MSFILVDYICFDSQLPNISHVFWHHLMHWYMFSLENQNLDINVNINCWCIRYHGVKSFQHAQYEKNVQHKPCWLYWYIDILNTAPRFHMAFSATVFRFIQRGAPTWLGREASHDVRSESTSGLSRLHGQDGTEIEDDPAGDLRKGVGRCWKMLSG